MAKPPRVVVNDERGMGLLDTLVVLVSSFTIVLLVLWIATTMSGHALFDQLPPWLSSMFSSGWGFLTGAGVSLLTGALKYLLDKNPDQPNYIAWIGGTSLCLMVLVGGVLFLIPRLQPAGSGLVSEVKLMFDVSFATQPKTKPNLMFTQLRPPQLGYRIIAHQGTLYQETIQLPGPGGVYRGSFVRQTLQSEEREDARAVPTEICFVRQKDPGRDDGYVPLKCKEGEGCSLDKAPAWTASCPSDAPGSPRSQGFTRAAFAQASPNKSAAGWRVPSLETLRAMREREGVGYTEFHVESEPLPTLGQADHFTFAIRVNGTPVFIDGWPPEYMRTAFQPAKGVSLAFGLENLNFSGARAGTEDIEVRFDFRNADKVLRSTSVSLRYVALRPSTVQTVTAPDGATFHWSANYVKPQNANTFEIFLLSTPSADAAEQLRRAIDKAALAFSGRPVVAVVRPPLGASVNFGVVLGIRRETGQIQFTFDKASSGRLCRWVVTERQSPAVGRLVREDVYRYEVDLRRQEPCRSVKDA